MSYSDEICSTPEGTRSWYQEQAILEATELICEIMKKQNVSRCDLAKWMGVSCEYINQLLDGEMEITLRMLSDVFGELGYKVVIDAEER